MAIVNNMMAIVIDIVRQSKTKNNNDNDWISMVSSKASTL